MAHGSESFVLMSCSQSDLYLLVPEEGDAGPMSSKPPRQVPLREVVGPEMAERIRAACDPYREPDGSMVAGVTLDRAMQPPTPTPPAPRRGAALGGLAPRAEASQPPLPVGADFGSVQDLNPDLSLYLEADGAVRVDPSRPAVHAQARRTPPSWALVPDGSPFATLPKTPPADADVTRHACAPPTVDPLDPTVGTANRRIHAPCREGARVDSVLPCPLPAGLGVAYTPPAPPEATPDSATATNATGAATRLAWRLCEGLGGLTLWAAAKGSALAWRLYLRGARWGLDAWTARDPETGARAERAALFLYTHRRATALTAMAALLLLAGFRLGRGLGGDTRPERLEGSEPRQGRETALETPSLPEPPLDRKASSGVAARSASPVSPATPPAAPWDGPRWSTTEESWPTIDTSPAAPKASGARLDRLALATPDRCSEPDRCGGCGPIDPAAGHAPTRGSSLPERTETGLEHGLDPSPRDRSDSATPALAAYPDHERRNVGRADSIPETASSASSAVVSPDTVPIPRADEMPAEDASAAPAKQDDMRRLPLAVGAPRVHPGIPEAKALKLRAERGKSVWGVYDRLHREAGATAAAVEVPGLPEEGAPPPLAPTAAPSQAAETGVGSREDPNGRIELTLGEDQDLPLPENIEPDMIEVPGIRSNARPGERGYASAHGRSPGVDVTEDGFAGLGPRGRRGTAETGETATPATASRATDPTHPRREMAVALEDVGARATPRKPATRKPATRVEEESLRTLGETPREAVRRNEVRLDGRSAEALLTDGIRFFDRGEIPAAISAFSRAIALEPENDAAWFNRGFARYAEGDLEEAIRDCSRAIVFNPANAQAFCIRGNARVAKGAYTEALADYDRAIELDPRYVEALGNRGVLRMLTRDLTGSLADLDQAVGLSPRFWEAYSNRGNTKLMLKDLAGAIADYDHALRLNPEFASAYFNRGRAWQERGDVQRALADFDEAVRLDPKQSGYYGYRARARYAAGDYEGSNADLATARRLQGGGGE